MPFTRLYFNQDAWISRKKYLKNHGDDAVIELAVSASNSSSVDATRLLIKFPIESYTASLSSAYSAILYLYNARNYKYTDQNFQVEIYPLTASWSEGIGSNIYSVSSAVSYIKRTQLANWSTSGGDYTSSPSAVITFENGTENLTANLSSFVGYWTANPNYGLLLKFSNTVESTTADYANAKSFFSRNSHTVYRPHVDITIPDTLMKDDRNNLHIGNNRFFFIDRNVTTTAYPGAAYLKADLCVSSGTAATLNYFSPSIWYINYVNSNMQWDGLFTVLSNTASNYSVTSQVTGTVINTYFNDDSQRININANIRNQYFTDEQPTLRIQIYTHVYIGMGSMAYSYYPVSAFMFFVERNTRKVVTPEMEMSYGIDGHFSKFNMANLLDGYFYIPFVKIIDGINDDVVYREVPEAAFYVKKREMRF